MGEETKVMFHEMELDDRILKVITCPNLKHNKFTYHQLQYSSRYSLNSGNFYLSNQTRNKSTSKAYNHISTGYFTIRMARTYFDPGNCDSFIT